MIFVSGYFGKLRKIHTTVKSGSSWNHNLLIKDYIETKRFLHRYYRNFKFKGFDFKIRIDFKMVPRNLYGSKCWLYGFYNIVFNTSEAEKTLENTIDINLTFHSRNENLSKKTLLKN